MNDTYQDVIRKILSFADLEPDWDSYGAKTVNLKAIRNTEKLLTNILTLYPNATPFDITPMSDGGIQLEWKGKNSIEVEIHAEDFAYLLIFDGDEDDWRLFKEDDGLDLTAIVQVIINSGILDENFRKMKTLSSRNS